MFNDCDHDRDEYGSILGRCLNCPHCEENVRLAEENAIKYQKERKKYVRLREVAEKVALELEEQFPDLEATAVTDKKLFFKDYTVGPHVSLPPDSYRGYEVYMNCFGRGVRPGLAVHKPSDIRGCIRNKVSRIK